MWRKIVSKKTLPVLFMHTSSSWKTQRNINNAAFKMEAIEQAVREGNRPTACKLDMLIS